MLNLEECLKSISKSLKSNSRENGPRLYNSVLNKIVNTEQSNKQNNSDFAKKVLEIVYNTTPAEYYEHTIKEYKSKITKKGAI